MASKISKPPKPKKARQFKAKRVKMTSVKKARPRTTVIGQ